MQCIKHLPPSFQGNLLVLHLIFRKNTHELLHAKPVEYLGIKTGFTCNAGSCLISCISIEGKEFIFVVLGSSSQHMRFRDTETLKHWLIRQ
jgi:D-alanyl-D-alanine carboxypeptidase